MSFGKFQADEQAWVDRVKSIGSGGTVRISTMDWLGESQYVEKLFIGHPFLLLCQRMLLSSIVA
ncbi:hypothetical protein ACJRO7_015328, partial [Eucalyptus globulus]